MTTAAPELTTDDSGVLFDLMERLTGRGYRAQVIITFPSGARLTLDGRPGTPVELPAYRQIAGDHHAHHNWTHTHPGGAHGPDEH